MDPFLGEIRICAFPFAPSGWAFCNGALLPLAQNQALFALLGVQYGGDGTRNFGLPDLRGRTAVHRDHNLFIQGETGGAEIVQLNATTLPQHTHTFIASSTVANTGLIGSANNHLLAATTVNLYAAPNNLVAMESAMCSTEGGGGKHQNMQPSLVVNYIIAISGIFPPRN